MTPAANLAQQDSTWHNKIRLGIMKADLAQGSPTWTKTIVECGERQRLMQTRCSKALEPCKNVCQLSKGRQRHYRLRYGQPSTGKYKSHSWAQVKGEKNLLSTYSIQIRPRSRHWLDRRRGHIEHPTRRGLREGPRAGASRDAHQSDPADLSRARSPLFRLTRTTLRMRAGPSRADSPATAQYPTTLRIWEIEPEVSIQKSGRRGCPSSALFFGPFSFT
ncbi:hypothetical protein BHM03_00001070 [Ensete ventricosum]|uniref:Uncharacterized protein n=1 Tax=Ensete ventricosum TaxID=4639 RepID=A0A445M8X7_ENSVE|nr:hypothetical protein BHM03_00001070 [Ensete ventricosum]